MSRPPSPAAAVASGAPILLAAGAAAYRAGARDGTVMPRIARGLSGFSADEAPVVARALGGDLGRDHEPDGAAR